MNRKQKIAWLKRHGVVENEIAGMSIEAIDRKIGVIASASQRPNKLPWLTVNLIANPLTNDASDGDTAEIKIYGQIGSDYYGDGGVDAATFRDELNAIPSNKSILVRIHSQGGNVWDGFNIYNALKERGNVTTRNDGVAASIASVIFQAGDNRQMAKTAMIMVHEASSLAWGNADELEKVISRLRAHDSVLCEVLADASGMSKADMSAMMKAETWMGGTDAIKNGLADEEVEPDSGDPDEQEEMEDVNARFDFSRFRAVPAAVLNMVGKPITTNKTTNNIMNRQQMIERLKKAGIVVADNATDQWLIEQLDTILNRATNPPAAPAPAATPSNVVTLPAPAAPVAPPVSNDTSLSAADVANFRTMQAQFREQQRTIVSNRIDEFIAQDRIPLAQRDSWITRAMADPAVLNDLALLPERPPGLRPLGNVSVENGDLPDLEKAFKQFNEPLAHYVHNGITTGARPDRRVIEAIGMGRRQISAMIKKHKQKLIAAIDNAAGMSPVMNANTNTISSGLQRQVIMSEIMRDFIRPLVPMDVFCRKFDRVPLEGTDKVDVPYYPLDTTASLDMVAATGYVFTTTGTTTNSIEVTVNKRKYKPIQFQSYEIRRQPWLDIKRLSGLAAEQVGVDVWQDILTDITAGNFGNAVLSLPYQAFTRDSMADLATACDKANWPVNVRNVIINADYNGNLMKDPSLVNVLNIGTDEVVRARNLGEIMGFQGVYRTNYIPATADPYLVGFAVHPAALVVATAPILPAPGVLRLLTAYDLATDDESGATLEYRYWGEPVLDVDREVIECNYGHIKANTAALKRIVSQGT